MKYLLLFIKLLGLFVCRHFASVCGEGMDSELTRADKRRRKKKERKRKQRQLYAISTKTNSILSDPEKDSEESSGKEEDKVPVTIPAICEECSENKVQYHCLDCKHYYCSSVGSWIDYCSF